MAIDYLKGYPWDCISHQGKLKPDENILAGMVVKENASGEVVRCDGTAGEQSFFAKENDTAKDVIFVKKLPYVMTNVVVLTDQYYDNDGAITINKGDNLAAGDTAYTGLAILHPGGASTKPVIGKFQGFYLRDGINYMAISKFD